MKVEIWKPINISSFEELYMVSNYGNVKSLKKELKNGSGYFTKKERLLKKHINNKGYEYLYLTNKYKRKKVYIHRLVAEAFIPNPDNKKEVNHIDCNPLNNKVNNLEWMTHKENMEYMVKLNRHKLNEMRYIKVAYKNIINGKRVARIDYKNKNICVYSTIQSVKEDGFVPSCVCLCCKGIAKKHKGYE